MLDYEEYDPADLEPQDPLVYEPEEKKGNEDSEGEEESGPPDKVEPAPHSYAARIRKLSERVNNLNAAASDWWIENECLQRMCDMDCHPGLDQRKRVYYQALSKGTGSSANAIVVPVLKTRMVVDLNRRMNLRR